MTEIVRAEKESLCTKIKTRAESVVAASILTFLPCCIITSLLLCCTGCCSGCPSQNAELYNSIKTYFGLKCLGDAS